MNTPLQENSRLGDLINQARRRWRTRRGFEGLAIWFAVVLVFAIVAIVAMDALHFEQGTVKDARGLFYGLSIVAFVILVLGRLPGFHPPLAVARYLESRLPALGSRLRTAVDTSEGRAISASPELASALVASTVDEHAQTVANLEKPAIRRALVISLVIAIVTVMLLAAGPLNFRFGASLLANPEADTRTANPYAVAVLPGDTTVLEGDDLQIKASTSGFIPKDISVLVRADESAPWKPLPMAVTTDATQASGAKGYDRFLFDIESAREYRVDADGVLSPIYSIAVIQRPQVNRIDLVYNFPKRTGAAAERVTDGGDIRAVRGTRVEVTVTPDRPVAEGQIIVNGDQKVALKLVDGKLRGEINVQESGQYRVELAADDQMTPASSEFAINALDDGLPSIRLKAPGRDSRVTMIEEVEFEVDAADDVAVNSLELVLSINGGPEEVVALEGTSTTAITTAHTEYLENRDLAPGDLISYFARVSDAADDASREVATDLYFINIRPFEQSFRASGGMGGGGGGGGGGGQQNDDLSAQQRQLVIALFKLTRDRVDLDEAVADERIDTLTQAQARIQDRVDAIVRRLRSRAIVDETPGVRQMTEELPKASKAMRDVSAQLNVGDVENALSPARLALLHLQRADAAFREVRISQSRNRGGNAGSATGDMSNLFRLEMDRFRNQYSDIQRGQQQQQQREQMDETMRKLQEISRRQTEELERAIGQTGRNDGSGQGTKSQQQLAEEVESLLRELRRLTRKKKDPSLDESMRKLEEAAEAMRESSSKGKREATRRAMNNLREARRALERSQKQGQQKGQRTARELREVMRDMQATRGAMPGAEQNKNGKGQQRSGEQPGETKGQQPGGEQQGSQPGGSQQAGNTQGNQPGGTQQRGATAGDNTGNANGGNPMRGNGNGERASVRADGQQRIDGDLRDLRQMIQGQADALGPVSSQARADNPGAAQDIDNVIETLNRLAADQDTDELGKRYTDALRALQGVERALREDDGDDVSVIATNRAEPDDTDREAIEDYYQRLSQ